MTVTARCSVQVLLKGDTLHSEATATATQTYANNNFTEKSVAMCKAKKQAYNYAVQQAFGKFIILRFDDGRIHVEINTTKDDGDDCLLLNESTLEVNECSRAPLDVSEDTDSDDTNIHILQDLEAAQNLQ